MCWLRRPPSNKQAKISINYLRIYQLMDGLSDGAAKFTVDAKLIIIIMIIISVAPRYK